MKTKSRDRSPSQATGARALHRREVLLALDRAGAIIWSSPRLGQLAGVGQRVAWSWLHGEPVSPEADRAIREAVGLPLRPRRAA